MADERSSRGVGCQRRRRMIQEIAPKRFWNAYEKRSPQADSKIICVCDGSYCIVHEDTGDRFPRYGEMIREAGDGGIFYDLRKLQYLFAILDGEERTDYFLCVCDIECRFLKLPPYSWEPTYYMNHKMKPRDEAFAGMTAHHLYVWYRDNHFCGRCGTKMVHDGAQRMVKCPKCKNMVFPKIAPAVLAAVRHNGKLLLTKYAHGEGNYALVAGFVEIGETAEECVAREVMEETGLPVKNVRYYDSQPWGFAGNLMLAYTAELDGEDDTIHRDASELAVAEWVAPEDITDIFDYSSLTREMIRRFREGQL